MTWKISTFSLLFFLTSALFGQKSSPEFRIRTITAGVSLNNLTDTTTIKNAIEFLRKAEKAFVQKGYEVQTLRISTQNFFKYLGQYSFNEALPYLITIDKIAKRENILFSIGQVLPPDEYKEGIGDWAEALLKATTKINFSVSISSHEKGIHYKSIKASSAIITAISKTNGGENCFHFTASANCEAGIPFFPAAFHDGANSFAVGLESPKLITAAFKRDSDPAHARQTLKSVLEENLKAVEDIANEISKTNNWPYDGIDASPAPGLDASIGEAIETYIKQPFGSPATLSACALITDVLKALDIKKCGYSGLMLPIIEDKVLAKRAKEGRFTVEELLLFSSVSGTGLDVVPVPGSTSRQVIESILTDVAALSLKYTAKALSVRLFLIPGKKAGDVVKFKNPSLTSSVVMKVN